MKSPTDKIFEEFMKAKEGKVFNSEEELQKFIDDFMTEHLGPIPTYADEEDYLEMAYSAKTAEEAIKYAKLALKDDPYCLDADLIIADAKSTSLEECKKNLEKVIAKGEAQLKERGISKEEDRGSFYGLFETRPYMRVRKAYLDNLILQGRFRLAVAECKELLELSKNDNMGIRYILMALYSFFEDEVSAVALYKKFEEDSAYMLLPLIALYFKSADDKKLRIYLKKLNNEIPKLSSSLKKLSKNPAEALEEAMSTASYRCGSEEELFHAFAECHFLYMSMSEFFEKLVCELKTIKK